VQTRRAVAVVVIVVIVVLMAVLIHGCEVSQSNNSLKDYAASVDTLMAGSTARGADMFSDLEKGELSSAGSVQTLQTQLNGLLLKAREDVSSAEALSAPGQLSSAQATLVQVMKLRQLGIGTVASSIQGAASTDTSEAAVASIRQGMYLLAGSDISYKTFVTPALAQALNAAGITVGGTSGVQIYPGQILNDLGWLNTRFIGEKTGADLPAAAVDQVVKGELQGHILTSVSVDGTPLSQGASNPVPASPAPTFTLNFTNGGQTEEYKVECIVTVVGLNDVGTATVPFTLPGHTYSCNVALPQQPPATVYKVTAEVHPVPGEADTSNNFQTYTVSFN
jgi:hypothetical protein